MFFGELCAPNLHLCIVQPTVLGYNGATSQARRACGWGMRMQAGLGDKALVWFWSRV
jgi:hypothetical protein